MQLSAGRVMLSRYATLSGETASLPGIDPEISIWDWAKTLLFDD
jgi:hypothetical protein